MKRVILEKGFQVRAGHLLDAPYEGTVKLEDGSVYMIQPDDKVHNVEMTMKGERFRDRVLAEIDEAEEPEELDGTAYFAFLEALEKEIQRRKTECLCNW